jgi:fructokinase
MSIRFGEVWVAGEALIDLMPGKNKTIPVVGGGPANAAKALANLAIRTCFIGGISTDKYGDLIQDELLSFGVDLTLSRKSNLPTATALVKLDENGCAKYQFHLEQTASFDFGDWLPIGQPKALYLGSLSTLINPSFSALFDWAKEIGVMIVYDPNVRPTVLPDKIKYIQNFEKWASISNIVKLSEDDLSWLGYGERDLFDFGVSLVVVTKGAKGISAFTRKEEVLVPAKAVDISDTVGAGDTVGAVIVEGVLKFGDLYCENLRFTLERAAKAAAITCSRPGANPPTLRELDL